MAERILSYHETQGAAHYPVAELLLLTGPGDDQPRALLQLQGARGEQERLREQVVSGVALVQIDLGIALRAAGKYEEAERAYKRALTHDPTFADVHYNLAVLYESRGRKREALRHLSTYKRLTRRPRQR